MKPPYAVWIQAGRDGHHLSNVVLWSPQILDRQHALPGLYAEDRVPDGFGHERLKRRVRRYVKQRPNDADLAQIVAKEMLADVSRPELQGWNQQRR